jgi:hypothetical protein
MFMVGHRGYCSLLSEGAVWTVVGGCLGRWGAPTCARPRLRACSTHTTEVGSVADPSVSTMAWRNFTAEDCSSVSTSESHT